MKRYTPHRLSNLCEPPPSFREYIFYGILTPAESASDLLLSTGTYLWSYLLGANYR